MDAVAEEERNQGRKAAILAVAAVELAATSGGGLPPEVGDDQVAPPMVVALDSLVDMVCNIGNATVEGGMGGHGLPKDCAEYVRLMRARRAVDDAAEVLKRLAENYSEYLAVRLAEEDVESIKVLGSMVYLRNTVEVHARGGQREMLAQALVDSGLSDLVRRDVNHSTLNAWYRRTTDSEQAIPDAVAELLERTDKLRAFARAL